jgi:hypothetical protein
LNVAQRKVAALKAVDEKFQLVVASLEDLTNASTEEIRDTLDGLVSKLKDDFGVLDATIKGIRGELDPADRRTGGNLAVQGTVQDRAKEIALSQELTKQVKSAGDIAEIRRVLLPWINTNLINPAFQEVQEIWNDEILPGLEGQVTQTKETLRDIPADAVPAPALLAELRERLDQVAQEARRIQFTAPTNDHWWTSVEGKGTTAEYIGKAAIKKLELTKPLANATELKKLSERARKSAEALETQLKTSLAAQEEAFKKQGQKLEDLAKPLSFLTLDLAYIATNFPLLLGFGLAAAIVWPAYRRCELARAHHLIAREDPEARVWADLLALNTRNRVADWLLIAAAVLWIALAAWQLGHFGIVSRADAARLGGLALIPVLGSIVYRATTSNGIKRLLAFEEKGRK